MKQLVDMWKTNYASSASEARLISLDELVDNFGYEYDDSNPQVKVIIKQQLLQVGYIIGIIVIGQ